MRRDAGHFGFGHEGQGLSLCLGSVVMLRRSVWGVTVLSFYIGAGGLQESGLGSSGCLWFRDQVSAGSKLKAFGGLGLRVEGVVRLGSHCADHEALGTGGWMWGVSISQLKMTLVVGNGVSKLQ